LSGREYMLAIVTALAVAVSAYLLGARGSANTEAIPTPVKCVCDPYEMHNVQLRLSAAEAKLNMLSKQPASPFPSGSPIGEKK
jgi:hypothetical protein